MLKKRYTYQSWLAVGVSLWCAARSIPCQAQITSDGTLSTNVTTSDNLNFTITGGSQAGGNLFHSFREFSVPTRGSAFFDGSQNIQNIISRVTGGSISNIDGLIRAQGSANLFLINPNGIIFGPNAQLQIGGSFLAITANRLNFADGTFFSTTDLQPQPLLTISVPVGLQFGKTAESVVNRSTAKDSSDSPIGLQVQPGKTLALLGGDLFLEGSYLSAPGGRIELGSVAGNSLVSLIPITTGWSFGYEGVQHFQDIQVSNTSVDVSGDNLGDVELRGRRIVITSGSQIGGLNFGANPGGTLVVNASESVEVSGNGSSLNTVTLSTGKAGDIEIKTRRLIVSGNSFIDTSSNGDGRGGNLTVDASESVEVNASEGNSQLSTKAFAGGNAGELRLTTGRLILRDGGQISSSTRAAGNGGTAIINASEFVEVSGQGKTTNGEVAVSGLFVSSQGSGKVGNLEVTAPSISLDRGTLDAETTGGGLGDITLNTQDLRLRHNSSITTNASNNANGGNINIDTGTLAVLENSNITATAVVGQGGNIKITTQGLFRSPDSDISASSQLGINGTVKINTLVNNPGQGLVTLPVKPINIAGQIAQGCPAGVGPRASKFVVTGRGGLPPDPTEALRSEPTLADLGTTVQSQENRTSAATSSNPTSKEPAPLVEAQGWVTNAKGEVVLVAQAPNATLHIPWLTPTTCLATKTMS